MSGDSRPKGPFKGLKTTLDAMLDFGTETEAKLPLSTKEIDRLKQIVSKLQELNARVDRLSARLDSIS